MHASSSLRAVLAIALSIGVLVLSVLQGVELKTSSERRIGVELGLVDGGVLLNAVEPGQPASEAGLAPGDRLLRIDGREITKLGDYDAIAESFGAGKSVTFTVERQGDPLTLEVRPGSPFPWLFFLINLVATLCYLALALFVLLQPRGDVRTRLLLLFSLSVALELAVPVGAIGGVVKVAVTLTAFYLLTGFQIGCELHLASVIPSRQPWLRRRPWVVPFFYAFGLGVGCLTAATYLVEDIRGLDLFPWTSTQAESFLLRVGVPLWVTALVVILAVEAMRNPEPRGRQQTGLVLAGVMPWALFVFTLEIFEKAANSPYDATTYETLALLCYPLAVFVAAYRFHLFDLELVVRRSLIYALLTGILILVFYSLLALGTTLFVEVFGESGSVWVVATATLGLGMLFLPLRKALQRIIDRRLFPERQEQRRQLVALSRDLPALGHLPRMGTHLVTSLGSIFAIRSVTLFIADPETDLLHVLASTENEHLLREPALLLPPDDPALSELRAAGRPTATAPALLASPQLAQQPELQRSAVLVPLTHQDCLVGLLAMGRKESGERYAAEELELLNLMAHHVAVVFENTRLFESATIEGLTGLLRREAILEQLERELRRAYRYHRPLSIGLADLDFFKDINDRYGHLAGDSMLRRIAQVMESGLRGTDWIGRYGGEEFLLVLPETTLEGARIVAEKIRQLVQATQVPMEDGTMARVTVSIGLSSLHRFQVVGTVPSAREMIAAADTSLYQAKGEGRNRVFPQQQTG